MENIFDPKVTNGLIDRIEKLTPYSKGLWGKMTVAQMLAHCNVTYELVYETKHPKPNGFVRFILKLLVKNSVVNEVPFKHNGQTAPIFIVKDDKNFESEKSRLINYLLKTQQLGEHFFSNKESHSFGVLSTKEWNNMFYKHLNHHLSQFGV